MSALGLKSSPEESISDFPPANAGNGEDMDAFMVQLNYYSRENGRTPMQWDDSPQAGFTSGTPWKRINDNYRTINVDAQHADPNSVLNHFRAMTKLRKENLVLVYGDYQLLQPEHPAVYAYTRELDGVKWLVLQNWRAIFNNQSQ